MDTVSPRHFLALSPLARGLLIASLAKESGDRALLGGGIFNLVFILLQ